MQQTGLGSPGPYLPLFYQRALSDLTFAEVYFTPHDYLKGLYVLFLSEPAHAAAFVPPVLPHSDGAPVH